MRMTRAALIVVAGLSLGLSGCNGDTDGTPNANNSTGAPRVSATTGSGSGSGNSASCVVGTWKSTGFSGSLATGGGNGNISGGAGYTMTVSPDGKTVVDFAGMQPIMFTASISGTDVKGSFTYGGKVNGAVNLAQASAASGIWEPTGTSDFSTLKVKLSLTSPVKLDLPEQSIAELAGMSQAQVGSAIDAQPVLKSGTYKCDGNSLTLGPPTAGGVGGTWTLQKA